MQLLDTVNKQVGEHAGGIYRRDQFSLARPRYFDFCFSLPLHSCLFVLFLLFLFLLLCVLVLLSVELRKSIDAVDQRRGSA